MNRNTRPVTTMLLALLFIAIASPTIAQDVVMARITIPAKGQTVRNNITIQGTASAPQFTRYQVDFATEPDLANWTLINAGTQPVTNGVLAVWNTRPLPDGKYAIRLQVFTPDGQAAEAYVRELELANAVNTPSPNPGDGVTSTAAITSATGIDTPGSSPGINLDLAAIPQAFLKGARYTLIAFGALIGYLLLKKIATLLLLRIFPKRVDNGR